MDSAHSAGALAPASPAPMFSPERCNSSGNGEGFYSKELLWSPAGAAEAFFPSDCCSATKPQIKPSPGRPSAARILFTQPSQNEIDGFFRDARAALAADRTPWSALMMKPSLLPEWDPVFLTLLTALDDGVPPRTVTTTGMAVVSIPGAKATKKRKCPDAAAAGDSSPQMITSS